VSGQLSWSHYCELLSISDESKRSFYEKEVINKLANTGIEIKQPQDILKDPYVFEFLGIPETKPLLEKDLEYKLIRHIEDFLLELGRGFMFVGSQQRITLNNTHYYVDMVFYNKILKAYVLIDLKMGKLKPENVGQINMYLNYYNTEINDEDDNPPIGIILCADKDEIAAEYALGGLNNQIFASKYTLYIPEKEKLIKEVECVLEKEKSEGVSNSGE
jgi:predicted nuclease of restriction endonuclease-like (RecB) superfamily